MIFVNYFKQIFQTILDYLFIFFTTNYFNLINQVFKLLK